VEFPSLGVEGFEIEIIHIILFAILIAIIFRTSDRMSKETETWITSNLNLHFDKIDQINEKLDSLYDIKKSGENIEISVESIREQGNV